MLCVDEGGYPTGPLCGGDSVQREGCFSRGFRAKHFDDAAAGKPTTAQSQVDGEAPGRDALDGAEAVVPQGHDRALPKLFFDLGQRRLQRWVGVRHGIHEALAAVLSSCGFFLPATACLGLLCLCCLCHPTVHSCCCQNHGDASRVSRRHRRGGCVTTMNRAICRGNVY